MPTKRTPIIRTPRLAWIEDMLAEGRPPLEWRAWQEYERWRQGQLAVPGLPDPGSDEGRRLLARLRVSLR